MARLFQSGGLVSVEKMPVRGSSLADLDLRRLEDYFLNILGEERVDDWQRTLLNRELLIADEWRPEARCCSYAACVLFAREPRRRMPQAGIRLLVFPGADLDYDANLDEVLPCGRTGRGRPRRNPPTPPGRYLRSRESSR